MQTIRSFTAIALPSDIQIAAGHMIERLGNRIPNVKWLDSDIIHLTLKFLGDVDNRDVPEVCKVLRHCCENAKPFSVDIAGAGAFPNPERPRIIWAGVGDQDEQLCQLVNAIDQEMGNLGFKREFRDYQPHLTLGRVKKGRAADSISEAIQQEAESFLGTLHVNEICLYASYLERGGPTYNVMDRVALK